MWKRSFRAKLPSKTQLWRCETEAFLGDIPQKLKVEVVKTKLSCEASLKKRKLEMWEWSSRVRLPLKNWKLKLLKTKLSWKTSLKNWKLKLLWQPLPWHSLLVAVTITAVTLIAVLPSLSATHCSDNHCTDIHCRARGSKKNIRNQKYSQGIKNKVLLGSKNLLACKYTQTNPSDQIQLPLTISPPVRWGLLDFMLASQPPSPHPPPSSAEPQLQALEPDPHNSPDFHGSECSPPDLSRELRMLNIWQKNAR